MVKKVFTPFVPWYKFEPFTRRFPDFKGVDRGLKRKTFDFLKFVVNAKYTDLYSFNLKLAPVVRVLKTSLSSF